MYRLEEVVLGETVDLKDGKPPLEKAFRLTIMTEKALPLGSYSIWFGDIQRRALAVGPTSVAIQIHSRKLESGVTLALSRFDGVSTIQRSTLPETLFVPSEYAMSWEKVAAETPIVSLRRLELFRPVIELSVEVPRLRCAIASVPFVIKINGVAKETLCRGDMFIVRFTTDQFNRLNKGATIDLKKWGSGGSVRRIGSLNKGTIE